MSADGLFRVRPLVWLVVLAAASALGAILLLAFGEEIAQSSSAGPNTYSYSAIGYRAAYTFLRTGGMPVARSRDPGMRELDAWSVVVLAEPVGVTGRVETTQVRAFLADVERRGLPAIVILPKWAWQASPMNPAWIEGAVPERDAGTEAMKAVLGEDAPETALTKLASPIDGARRGFRGEQYDLELAAPQLLLPSPRLEPLVAGEDGVLVARLRRDGTALFVVSDPDLFNNQGLGRADHAALLLDLVSQVPGVRSVVFDETIHGYENRAELLSWLLTFPALPITLHLALVGALAVWVGASRFGSPRRSEESLREGRERFVDTAARAMIGSGGEASSLGRYWSHTLEAVADALHLPPLEPADRLERLAVLAARRKVSEDPRSLDREIAEALDRNARPERWAALASRVHAFRRGMLHAAG
jgi:hypothetical protein